MLNRFRPLIDTLLLPRNFFARSRTIRRGAVFALAFAAGSANAEPASSIRSLEALLQSQELTVLADVKHGVRERIEFFSSTALFKAMKRAGVRHVAIEMPRVLGRQAMGIESEVDVNAFAQDVIRSGHWHFVDPDHPDEIESATQERVATALGRQVLLAKTLGINPIFYDFNNPLGGFTTFNDPVYRCIAELSGVTWVRYGLDGKISKAERDAAIMRERFSHDDELADYIEQNVRANGGGKIVLIPGYAHAALPGGITERLAHRLQMKATVVAVFRDAAEDKGFHDFLWQQAHLLSIDLSRPPHFYYSIATDTLRADNAPGRYVILDGSTSRTTPSVCHQLAHID
jgi:hypothetical protein